MELSESAADVAEIGATSVGEMAPLSQADLDAMAKSASSAAEFLKALSHEGRLMILCNLVGGELSVTELEQRVGMRQAAVSQQLARLRLEGLVTSRREGKAIYYALGDPKVAQLIGVMHDLFCPIPEPAKS